MGKSLVMVEFPATKKGNVAKCCVTYVKESFNS